MTLTLLTILATLTIGAASDEDLLSTFELHPDFEMSLVAREPIVFDPVDLEFDAAGRAFVVEMGGYPLRDVAGRIVLLEDTDDDGVYDSRTVFVDGLEVADSILPYRDGLLVASPPDLLFYADRDGDNKAEYREVVLTGFPAGNTQHNYNGLTHGIDNWIYGANGGNNGEITWGGRPDDAIPLRRNDFRFDIDRQQFEPIGSSSGGFGLAFDSQGRLFETHNLRHIMHLAFSGRYTAGLPDASTLSQIASYSENGLSRVFPIGEQASRPNHPEQAGFFSAACGITAYTGGAFPEAFADNVFVADAVLNLIHRMTIHPDDTGLEARRGRERVEFLASRDRAFRPVNMSIGPDGALYVLDMHRDHIEHPEWIPDELEAEMDLKAGTEKGRIYRIVPKGGLPRVSPSFSRDSLASVVIGLGHPNKWVRDTTQRLLVSWKDPAAVPLLEAQLVEGETDLARMHSCWTLAGLGALTEEHIQSLLDDTSALVREQALIAAEPLLATHPALVKRVTAACTDDAARVRRQALLALSTVDRLTFDDISDGISYIASKDASDPWMRLAVLAAGREHALPLVESVLHNPDALNEEGSRLLLGLLCKLAAFQNQGTAMAAILPLLHAEKTLSNNVLAEALSGLSNRGSGGKSVLTGKVATALDSFLQHASPSVAQPAWILATKAGYSNPTLAESLFTNSSTVVNDKSASVAARVAHLGLVAHTPFAQREALLHSLLISTQPKEIHAAAMEQLSKQGSVDVATWLIENWRFLGPELIRPATNVLLYRNYNQPLMLTALEEGTLKIGQFNMDLERRRRLLRSKDENTRERAQALFSDAGVVTRKVALEAMKPALTLAGDAVAGNAIFEELCLRCHQIGDNGHMVGPNLTEIFRKSKESLLQDILDPNAAVDTRFVSYTVALKEADLFADESQLSGMIAADTATSVTLRVAGGIENTFERDKIASMTSTGLSVMPEGLELGHTHQQFADLLAYLASPR